jgi:hypothetical protein
MNWLRWLRDFRRGFSDEDLARAMNKIDASAIGHLIALNEREVRAFVAWQMGRASRDDA